MKLLDINDFVEGEPVPGMSVYRVPDDLRQKIRAWWKDAQIGEWDDRVKYKASYHFRDSSPSEPAHYQFAPCMEEVACALDELGILGPDRVNYAKGNAYDSDGWLQIHTDGMHNANIGMLVEEEEGNTEETGWLLEMHPSFAHGYMQSRAMIPSGHLYVWEPPALHYFHRMMQLLQGAPVQFNGRCMPSRQRRLSVGFGSLEEL